MKNVFIFLANGFEEVEAVVPIDYLRRAGANLITIGVPSQEIYSSHKIKLICDTDIYQIEKVPVEPDMIILPGGLKNAETLGSHSAVKNITVKTFKTGGIVAAICASPVLALAEWGLLDNKKYTCYPGMGSELKCKPENNARVVRDGTVITAAAAGVSEEFAFTLIQALYGEDISNKIKREVLAR